MECVANGIEHWEGSEEELSPEEDEDIDYEAEVYNYQQLKIQEKERQKLAVAAATAIKVNKLKQSPKTTLVGSGSTRVGARYYLEQLKEQNLLKQLQSKSPLLEKDYNEENGQGPYNYSVSNSNGNGFRHNFEDEEDEDYDDQSQDYSQEQDDEEDGEEYPDTLMYCETTFDDDGMHDNDEVARGLPPLTKGNDDFLEGSRITTNESGIRIVESSTLLDPESEEDYDYQYGKVAGKKQVQMNKPRKIKPEKIATEELLKQLQSGVYDGDYKPNILARKLMGVPSQTVQTTRPPPLLQKPMQQQNAKHKLPPTTTISLESILRQQKTSNTMRLHPKSSNGNSLVIGGQLKIKPNHIIPSEPRHKVQKLQVAPSQHKSSKFIYQNHQPSTTTTITATNSRSILAPNFSAKRGYQYQQASSSQLNSSSSSARTNGAASLLNSNRATIASIQQQIQTQQHQQQNAIKLQQPQMQTKPQKNIPRCPICKRTFATNQVLQRHMALHGPIAAESEGREYKCDECPAIFDTPMLLNQHMKSHNSGSDGAEGTVGGNCSESGASSAGLQRCRVCYRTFTCLESLKQHALMHDGEFKCRACRRGFTDWNALEEHEATHKRYNCQWCEKYFMNSGNLKAHERIHTGERPYRCADCVKAFKQLGGLQYHLKTNPTHRPQKYHKHDMENPSEETDDGYQYGSYEGDEEYQFDDNGIMNLSVNSSLAEIAEANGL